MKRNIRAGALLATALVAFNLVANTGSAIAETTTLGEGATSLFSTESSQWYSGEPILDHTSSVSTSKQSRLSPTIIALCNLGFGDVVVASVASKSDGVVDLKCGDLWSGYVHIRDRHQTDWEAQMGSGAVWDDYMVWASKSILSSPSRVVTQVGMTRCYTAPIQVYRVINGINQLWKTINPSVIVSVNNKKVITSIPSTTSSC